MADYFSLLSKLLDGLPDATPPIRRGVYDRARRALTDQLKTVQPALSADEIGREAASLEDAIRQLEARYQDAGAAPSPPAPPPPSPPIADRIEIAPNPPDVARPSPVAIKRGGRRRGPGAMLLGLVLLAIPVAVIAWIWRGDGPASPPDSPPPPLAAATPASQTDPKYGERVAGGPSSTRRDAPSPPRPSPSSPPPDPDPSARLAPSPPAAPVAAPEQAVGERPLPAAAQPPGSDLAVAQRAVIFEENQIDPQQPIISAGRAVWRLDAINGGQGMALETVIRGRVDLPAAGLSLNLVATWTLPCRRPTRSSSPSRPRPYWATRPASFVTWRCRSCGRTSRSAASLSQGCPSP